MPKSHDELNETIQRLHDELAVAENLDAKMADALRSAVADIQEAIVRLGNRSASEEEDSEPPPVPHGQLSDAAREFEGSHPVLSRTIGQLADILGQMGI